MRRHVADVEEAQDLTQEFFAWLLEKNTLAAVSPERGRFRGFLLTAVKNFLANQWDRAKARKRGGGVRRLSLDLDDGESRLRLEPAHELTPERLYERQWGLTLLELVIRRLREEYQSSGKAELFERLEDRQDVLLLAVVRKPYPLILLLLNPRDVGTEDEQGSDGVLWNCVHRRPRNLLKPLGLVIWDVGQQFVAMLDLSRQTDRTGIQQRGVEHAGG